MSLRIVLLSLLSKKRTTGYDIGRLLHSQLSHVWVAQLQQIYVELCELEAQGLVESESIQPPKRPRQKIYSLTPSGSKALDQWLEKPPAPISFKNKLLVKLLCMERLAQGLVESESIQPPKRLIQKIYSRTPSGGRDPDQWLEGPPAPTSFKNEVLATLYSMERLPNDFLIARLEERQADFEAMAQNLRGRLIDARRTAPDQSGYLPTLEAALSTAEEQASWCARKAAELREAEPAAAAAEA